jgi:hypothetical protein
MYRLSNLLSFATYNHRNEETIIGEYDKNPLELTIEGTSYIFSGTENKYSKQLAPRILSWNNEL